MLRVLLAPNAFKGSLLAADVARAMAEGVARVAPGADVTSVPIADGGDGSVDAFVAAGYTRVPVVVRGPTGAPVDSSLALRGGQAIVELASSCGMTLLPGGVPAPMTATTEGLGDAVLGALDAGADDLLVCLGGSASTDGGTGLLTALGAVLIGTHGEVVPPGGAGLADVAGLDLSGLDPRLSQVTWTLAVDVSSPLYGPTGAAVVFAPQKGATPEQVAVLDEGLRSWSRVLTEATGADVGAVPGSGAAGGTAAAALAAFGAALAPGAGLIADLVGLDAALDGADVVITGEGRLDHQSTLGKGAGDVAARARGLRVPALAVCGRIDLTPDELVSAGFAGWSDCVSLARTDARAREQVRPLVAEATAVALDRWLRSR